MPLKFPRRIRHFTHYLPRTTNLASFNSGARAYHRYNTSSSSAPFLSRIFSFTLNHFSTRPNGGEARASSRSLIEDEEELSNWVTDLRPGSLRVHLTSDDDDDVDRSRGRNQDSRGAIRNKVGSFRENRFSERGKGSNFGRSESSFRGRKERSLGRDREEGYKGLRKQRRGDVVDEESSDEDVMGGIGDLLSEEDEEEEEDEDYEFLKKKAASAFGFDRDKGVEARSDVKSSDSYLTKTR